MSTAAKYTTKELSLETWPDFEKLFTKPGGWNHCWCMHFQRPGALPRSERLPTRAQRAVRNRRQKRKLIEQERAHGILVYSDGEPVGWCQYGLCDELPRIDNSSRYRGLALEGKEKVWRIPCFVVDSKHRRRGVASVALKAALQAIMRQGGGVVEAYPMKRWLPRAFGNESTHGVLSMFENEGFMVVATFSETRFSTRVLVRKQV